MPETSSCTLLDWDTSFFSSRVARLTAERLSVPAIRRALEWCSDQGVSTLYYLCPASDVSSRQQAESSGFHLVDIRITLRRDFRTPSEPRHSPSQIRPWKAGDLPELKTLAAASHHDTRFYSDPFFPRDLCDRLYSTWIERSCLGYDNQVWVAENNGHIAGYITASISEKRGQIGLLAVSEQERGIGRGAALIGHAMDWFHESGASSVQVVTQGCNVKAQRLYQRANFATQAMDLWYHWHPHSPLPGRG